MTRPDERPLIQLIDDAPENLTVLVELLQSSYRIRVATSGPRGIELAQEVVPDLILLDVVMPDVDGYETCRQLKAEPRTAHVPVIFLTSHDTEEHERRGFEVGAVDYVRKPIRVPTLMARIRTHIELKRASDTLRNYSSRLEAEVAQRTHELSTIQDVTILTMASLAETRDNETGNHIRRTQLYVRELALALRHHPRFRDVLTAQNIELLYKSAPLHDIGKVGVPDDILRKPGKLTTDEFEQMKLHTVYGRDAIRRAEVLLDADASFLRFAREIAYAHQEKWDGSGYPEGLAGDAIPLSTRIMAVADVYDALISARVYKPAFSHAEAVDILRRGRGQHFDPDILDAFLDLESTFEDIACAYADAPAPR